MWTIRRRETGAAVNQNRLTNQVLFDLGPRRDDETPDARARRLNRARQMRFRRRHQFAPPLIEAPIPTYTTCSGQ